MRNLDQTQTMLLLAIAAVGAMALAPPGATTLGTEASAQTAPSPAPAPAAARAGWAASATGRVEPKDGQILIGTQVPGRVADVAIKSGDKVQAGDLLVRLEEDDLMTRVTATAVDVQVRERERDEEVAKGLALERRQAEDSVASAERALFRARLAFDEVAFKVRTNSGGSASDVDKARFNISAAKEQLTNSRSALARVITKDGMPLATRFEASLAAARGELSLAEAAVERVRIRAPSDGNVLNVSAKFGELVAPSPDAPLIVFGDLKSLRIKAEVEERDATKVRIGQRVIVKGDAFPDKQFEGAVSSISQMLAPPRIATRGVRRPNDIEVLEVMVALDGTPPLMSGMRVDVFFKAEEAAAQAPSTPASTAKTN